MPADIPSKQVLEKFWAKRDYITLWRGIQKFKIHTEGNKLKFSWYSDPHYTLFLAPLWLG